MNYYSLRTQLSQMAYDAVRNHQVAGDSEEEWLVCLRNLMVAAAPDAPEAIISEIIGRCRYSLREASFDDING